VRAAASEDTTRRRRAKIERERVRERERKEEHVGGVYAADIIRCANMNAVYVRLA
jgi:hypothetical protein